MSLERLQELERKGRLAQGLLFIGPEESKRKHAALLLAAQLVCEAEKKRTTVWNVLKLFQGGVFDASGCSNFGT